MGLFAHDEATKYSVGNNTIIYMYIERKTKASDRDSKARRSLGNLYALYVLCEDFLNGNQNGSSFTNLMSRMKAMPFGAKLQNHPLDNRLNDEVKRQYGVSETMLPVQVADLGDGRQSRKISYELLSEGGMNANNAAAYVVESIGKYIETITNNQTSYLNELELAESDDDVLEIISSAFDYNSDARLFEIISFALLYIHFQNTQVTISMNGQVSTQNLTLYRTGRTNANDGGIDFILQPLGDLFQVTETLDFKKYFLDFDKINRCQLTFVIKTELTPAEVMQNIRTNAMKSLPANIVEKYLSLFKEIITLNELKCILERIKNTPHSIIQLRDIVIYSFKLEYGLLD